MTESGGTENSASMNHARFVLTALPLACTPAPIDLGEDLEGEAEGQGSSGGDDEAPEQLPAGTPLREDFIEDAAGYALSVAPDGTIYVGGRQLLVEDGTMMNEFQGAIAADGTALWWRSGPSTATPSTLAATEDGVYVGRIGPDEFGVVEARDADGGLEWVFPLEGLTDVAATSDGALIAVGNRDGVHWILSYDRAADESEEGWSHGGIPQSDVEFSSVAVDADDTTWVVGSHRSETGVPRRFIVRFDEIGDLDWETTFGLAGAGTPQVETHSGGVLVSGTGAAGFITRFGADTSLQLEFSDPFVESDAWVAATPDGGFAVARDVTLPPDDPDACTTPWGRCPSRIELRVYNPAGELRWEASTDRCNGAGPMAVTPTGLLVVLGTCVEDGSGATELALLRYVL